MKKSFLILLICCAVLLCVLADAPFRLAIASSGGAGMLALAGVSNGFCQVESAPQLGSSWVTYPMTGAVVAVTSTQMAINLPYLDQQRFFRAVHLGTNPVTVSQPVFIRATNSFQRTGNSIDPVTGAVAGANTPNLRNVELPVWPPGQGLQRIGGTNFVVGIRRDGALLGTPNILGQGALFLSTNAGITWNPLANLPTQRTTDAILRICSVPFRTNELVFASMQQGWLLLSTNQGLTFSKNLLPTWYSAEGTRAPFHDNLLVEAVAGKPLEDCHLLACLYGSRLEGGTVSTANYTMIGCIYVFRTSATLKQMAAGTAPQFELAWKQDYFDFFTRYVTGAIAVNNHTGLVSGTTNTLTDATANFGANVTTYPRCVRIVSGTGAGQSRMVVSNTPNTLTVYTPWQVTPDSASDYQIINGGVVGQGMHLHCATWLPQSRNGDSNVLFVSFGDKSSGHVCRIPSFDQLGVNPSGEDYSGLGWNYSDTQVFAVGHQPTAMWPDGNGQLYFLARDYDGTILNTPDDVFIPQDIFEDSFNPYGSTYDGVGYDALVGSNQVAVVAKLTEGTVGQYGIYVGDPTGPQQMYRYVRGLSLSSSGSYNGYGLAYGNPQSSVVVVSADSFGSGVITNTWLIQLPSLTNIQAILVANAATNLISNADFMTNSGIMPSNWYRSGPIPASALVYAGTNIYGGGLAWQVGQTNQSTTTDFIVSMPLTGFSPARPLCLSFPYRIASTINASYSAPAALRIQWNSTTSAIRIDSSNGNSHQVTNQWHTDHYSVIPPANAIKALISYEFRSYTGSVDVALPSANWSRYAVPAVGARAADVLEYATAASDWSGILNSHVEFLVLPLWPTDVNPYARETLCSLLSGDGCRCLLTWDYNLGFQALLQDSRGKPLLSLNLGQLHLLTRFDPCRFVVDFQHGVLTVKLDAGGDVLQAVGATNAINSFNPIKIRLGSDQFNGANLGWEGYYALLACQGSN